MAKKEKKFHLKLSNIIRIFIFLLVFFSLINLLSKNQLEKKVNFPSPNQTQQKILNNAVIKLFALVPEETKQKISHLPNTPAVKEVQKQIQTLGQTISDIPKKAINDIKIYVAKLIYQSIIGND